MFDACARHHVLDASLPLQHSRSFQNDEPLISRHAVFFQAAVPHHFDIDASLRDASRRQCTRHRPSFLFLSFPHPSCIALTGLVPLECTLTSQPI